ncbi:ATPase [Pseudomassariella vexata]|uniref:ATPase n=1 Tax=Pseudomassariella vexata TaxID=1141098 RepID=A0A1Y2EFH6_9PEZI|nr:ATPase [Pseudomassariella vexata]ORY70333.1 ATPase [Pseudomassariella vexata]
MRISKDDMSEVTWKWWCKTKNLGRSTEKTLADFNSDSTSSDITESVSAGKATSTEPRDENLGFSASLKTFYEGPGSFQGMYNWVDYPPRQMSKSAAKAQDRVAVKLFKIKDTDKPIMGNRFALKYHSIELQNPNLVAAIEPILKKEDVRLDSTEPAKFYEPFRSLYFCYDEIVAKYKSLPEGSSLNPFLLLFIKVMDEVFVEVRTKKRNLEANKLISFNTAWAYFARDAPVISRGPNCEFMCKIVNTNYVKTACGNVLYITVKILRFNGDAFVWEQRDFKIPEFAGNQLITELDHFPLEYHENAQSLWEQMDKRGRMVLDHQGLTYCTYSGIAIYREGINLEKHNVDGRILIDVVGYNKHHLIKGEREGTDTETQKNIVAGTGTCQRHKRRTISQPADSEVAKNDGAIAEDTKTTEAKRLSEKDQKMNKQSMLERPGDLMYMWPLLEGYALKNKLWISFFVEDIRPIIAWNDQAFEHLVYDEQQKDLVLSFVESHGHSTHQQLEDVIVGKVALQELEKHLQRKPDIARNELVSIFLRELEYFRGIIFLTTNLYQTIDTAFRSRVNLHLLFKPLTIEARGVVWRKFLDRLPGSGEHKQKELQAKRGAREVEISEEDIKELAMWQLNGREIKNAVKMVKSWCEHKEYEMTLQRLENGIKATSPHAARVNHNGDTDIYDD